MQPFNIEDHDLPFLEGLCKTYRITYFGPDGDISSVEVIDAVTDAAALRHAQASGYGQRVEIRTATRLVAKFTRPVVAPPPDELTPDPA